MNIKIASEKTGLTKRAIKKDFEEYLCILNEDYKKYKENTTKMLSDVNKAVKDRLGFTTNELIKTFDQEN